MFEDFIVRAILAGAGIAVLAGPLGSIIVWKRMTFFGDALSHSSLLGIALSFVLKVSSIIGIMFFATIFCLMIAYLQKNKKYSNDTLLAIVSHGSLAVGLVVISFIENAQINLVSFLFGDILSVSYSDVYLIYACVLISLVILYFIWPKIVLITISEDLAQIEGINVSLVKIQFMLLVALFVALAIKVVGVLLVTSLLVIPTATARIYSTTPEKMAILSVVVGVLSIITGIYSSLYIDTPAGPSIVVSSVVYFILSNFFNLIKIKKLP